MKNKILIVTFVCRNYLYLFTFLKLNFVCVSVWVMRVIALCRGLRATCSFSPFTITGIALWLSASHRTVSPAPTFFKHKIHLTYLVLTTAHNIIRGHGIFQAVTHL